MIAQLDGVGLFHVASPRRITQCVRVAIGLPPLSHVPVCPCSREEVAQMKRERAVVPLLRSA